MSFVGRWLADALRLVLALGVGLGAMQLPAIAHQYAAALLQVADSGRRDIEQRVASARSFYPGSGGPGAGGSDADVIAGLAKVEPSNARALQVSMDRVRSISAAEARIDGAAPAVRPMVAAVDVLEDGSGEKRTILGTTLSSYSAQIELSGVALLYGLAGLLIGTLLAELVASSFGAMFRPRNARRLV